jgi:hypothetical protein
MLTFRQRLLSTILSNVTFAFLVARFTHQSFGAWLLALSISFILVNFLISPIILRMFRASRGWAKGSKQP